MAFLVFGVPEFLIATLLVLSFGVVGLRSDDAEQLGSLRAQGADLLGRLEREGVNTEIPRQRLQLLARELSARTGPATDAGSAVGLQ